MPTSQRPNGCRRPRSRTVPRLGRVHFVGLLGVVGLALVAAACAVAQGAPVGEQAASLAEPLPLELAPIALPGSTDGAPGADQLVAEVGEPAVRVEPPRRTFTMAFTGDNLTHSPLVRRAAVHAGGTGYDFRPMYDRVRPLISMVDLAICHLETPIAPPGEPLSTAPLYGVPAELADALAFAGYDRCSTASNHTLDRGVAGIEATVGNLERVGISQVGMARTPEESVASLVEVQGVVVGHLSYTFSYNGLRTARGEEWRSNLIDPARIIADAADARARGAQVVVVSVHDGNEGSAAPTPGQQRVAQQVTASGMVDLIVGHHAHVLQPIEWVNGRWVVYGLGNFISNMPASPNWPASSQDGAIVTVRVNEQPDGSFVMDRPVVHPTWVDKDRSWVIRPVLQDLDDPAVSEAVKSQLRASLERTRSVLGPFVPS